MKIEVPISAVIITDGAGNEIVLAVTTAEMEVDWYTALTINMGHG